MVKPKDRRLKVGDPVLVPWGLAKPLSRRVIEVWGDPDDHVRIKVMFDGDDEPMFFLVPSSWLLPAA